MYSYNLFNQLLGLIGSEYGIINRIDYRNRLLERNTKIYRKNNFFCLFYNKGRMNENSKDN